ncbi:LOW QUALITY PROTEIN: hypothetical protein HID58_071022 [Brassica napus]|uniref:Uncharacterized protein n=1 Tax=Brassica napus TaxID=3708 RepID=A0ABQ7Z0H1_BRANA|nr:LOW QUALITY PROTEIN: hypothetical protein HID58_071022 [Brassica napus]
MVLDCCFVLFQICPAKNEKVRSNDFRTTMFERKKSPNRLMHVYDEFECSGMLTRITHALKFSAHLKFESLRMRIRRQEEAKMAHLLLIVSFDDMQRAMPTFSSIALDRKLEPESTSEIWGLYVRWSRIKGDFMRGNVYDRQVGNFSFDGEIGNAHS